MPCRGKEHVICVGSSGTTSTNAQTKEKAMEKEKIPRLRVTLMAEEKAKITKDGAPTVSPLHTIRPIASN